MSAAAFFNGARWLLLRLLVALLVSLAIMVAVRQFQDGGSDERALGERDVSAQDGPHIGDHWHASYVVFICTSQQLPFRLWEGGVHTHDDGIIHIHPTVPSEEGDGATLARWFEYGGGLLTQTQMRMPGTDQTLTNGDPCPDGVPGILQVFANSERLDNWIDYIPQHGDEVVIVFGRRVPG